MEALTGLALAAVVALCAVMVMTAMGQQPLVSRDGPAPLVLLRGVPCDAPAIVEQILPQHRKDFSKGSLTTPEGVVALCWDEERTRLSPGDDHYVVVLPQGALLVPKKAFGQPI